MLIILFDLIVVVMGLGPMVGKFAGWRRSRRNGRMPCSMAWEMFYGKGWAQVGLTAETGDWRGAGLFTQVHGAANYLSGSWRAWHSPREPVFFRHSLMICCTGAPRKLQGAPFILNAAWALARIPQPFHAI